MRFRGFIALSFAVLTTACSDSENYQQVPEVSPVIMDLTAVPYPKLSDYKFFTGDIREQQPAFGVLPYKPVSELFTDYATKRRFIWLPSGSVGQYVADDQILNLPVGAALIKTFSYDNVAPGNNEKLIETRVMIRKESGWITVNYIWNSQQTEAFLDPAGATVPITFTIGGNTRSISYQIPSEGQCIQCHTLNSEITPIGIKPQHLNYAISYPGGSQNQLDKLVAFGYLNSRPANVVSMVNYNDTSADLSLRVRSYFDINCAHCHADGAMVDYLPLRFSFSATVDPAAMGVCENAFMQPPGITHGKVIKPGDTGQSVLYYTLNTTQSNFKMPRIGRTIIHDEAVALVGDYINSLQPCN